MVGDGSQRWGREASWADGVVEERVKGGFAIDWNLERKKHALVSV